MQPIFFEGSTEIKKPENVTDEQCMSIWAMPINISAGKDEQGNELISRMWVEAWQPSREDIQAINCGGPIWIQIHSMGLPPVAVFTMDENGKSNDAG